MIIRKHDIRFFVNKLLPMYSCYNRRGSEIRGLMGEGKLNKVTHEGCNIVHIYKSLQRRLIVVIYIGRHRSR